MLKSECKEGVRVYWKGDEYFSGEYGTICKGPDGYSIWNDLSDEYDSVWVKWDNDGNTAWIHIEELEHENAKLFPLATEAKQSKNCKIKFITTSGDDTVEKVIVNPKKASIKLKAESGYNSHVSLLAKLKDSGNDVSITFPAGLFVEETEITLDYAEMYYTYKLLETWFKYCDNTSPDVIEGWN